MLKNIALITIENFNREYLGKSLLSEELVRKGFIVFLGHKSIIRVVAKLLKLKNCIFIDKGNRFGSLDRLKNISNNGQKIYLFDEEALMQTDYLNFLKRNHEKESIPYINGVFSWGPKHSNLLVKAGYKNHQIIKLGNPRFDKYLIKKEFDYSDKCQDTILICSRFASANPNKIIKTELDKRDSSKSYINDCLEVLSIMIKMPRFLRENGINNKILIRPHPSESLILWEESSKDLENVKVEFKGSINSLFASTSLLIHNRCTTSIEAFLNQIPIISFEPISLNSPPHPDIDLFNSFSNYQCHNLKQIVKTIDKIKYENSTFKVDNQVNKYLYFSNEISSIKISKLLDAQSKKISFQRICFYFLKIMFSLPLIFFRNNSLTLINRFNNFNDFKYKLQKNGEIPRTKLLKIKKDFFIISILKKINIYIPKLDFFIDKN